MAAIATTNPTLADWAKSIDPDGKVAAVAEVLSQTNEILDDCVFRPGNLPTGHRVVIRTGLPEVYWRSFNQGIPTSKATKAQVDEGIGMLEARSEIDVDLAKLNGNTDEFRLSEDRAFLEAMNQEMATTMFYGNPATDPKKFLGLSPRYSSLSAGNAQNIIDGLGASGNTNTSVWLVVWGDETVWCPFPDGTTAGLTAQDLGEDTVYDVNGVAGTRMQAYCSLFQWKNGLCVKDWRYAVRICNLEVADLTGLSNEQLPTAYTNLIHKMAQAVYRIPSFGMGRPCWYMNRTVHSALSRMAMVSTSGVLKIEDGLSQFGTPRKYLSFMGIPIRLSDALLNTEAKVT